MKNININDLQIGDRIQFTSGYHWQVLHSDNSVLPNFYKEDEPQTWIFLEHSSGGMGHLDLKGILESDNGSDLIVKCFMLDPREEVILLERTATRIVRFPDHSQWEIPSIFIERLDKSPILWEDVSKVAVQTRKPDLQKMYKEFWTPLY